MNVAALCPVCRGELAPPNVTTCIACRRDFHLQMRTDIPGKDCGRVWLHEEHLHLVFACNECLEAGAFDSRPAGGAGAT